MSLGTVSDHDLEVVHDIEEIIKKPAAPPPSFPETPAGPDDDGHDDDDRRQSPISSARLAVLLFLGAEAMFFAGLLSTYLVFRTGQVVWPAPLQPRLPILVTALNTMVLLYSAWTMRRALRAIRQDDQRGLVDRLTITAMLGLVFLAVQGYEWARLLRFGLTLSSGVYGATFYALIGSHAVHVFGAVVWCMIVLGMARRGHFSAQHYGPAAVCGLYWYFFVALWAVLFVVVYLY
jgi:heme/copper-type cytochrome/quinol oxidase subunit 3